jgi:hypothetical protein
MIKGFFEDNSYFEMATLTDRLLEYGLNVKIGGAGEETGNQGRQEHNPPHFHIRQVNSGIEIKVIIETFEILAVYLKSSLIKKGDETGWGDSLEKLKFSNAKSVILRWLKRKRNIPDPDYEGEDNVSIEITNYQYVGYMWNLETQENHNLTKLDWRSLDVNILS